MPAEGAGSAPAVQLYAALSGSDDDLLVLLHGLGATADIWLPLLAARPAQWQGRILLLDLPGHGTSAALDSYDMPAVAAAVAGVVRHYLRAGGSYRVLGHSYGGAVALELGRVPGEAAPDFVFGLGIKSVWTEQEIQHMGALARKPPRVFASEREATAWYRKVTGLAGLDSCVDCTGRGIRETAPGQWCLAVDPRVHAITPIDMCALADANRDRFALAYGAQDTMVNAADLARHDPAVSALAGGGHNIMVDNPAPVWAWLSDRGIFTR
jgi:pimeloyl-ACP methyl ester carboxylesterase